MAVGCAKDAGQSASSSPVTVNPEKRAESATKSTPLKSALPLLSAQEVAVRLAADPTPLVPPLSSNQAKVTNEGSRENAHSVQFAQSLEKHAHSDAVVAVVRTKIRSFDTVPAEQKPSFIILGAEVLSVSDTQSYAHALRSALRSLHTSVRITALATLSRHKELSSDTGIRNDLAVLLTGQKHLDPVTAHWLTVTTRSIVNNSNSVGISDMDRTELLRSALVNPDLDLPTLTQEVDRVLIQKILERDAKSFTPSRAAQVRSAIMSGGRS